MSWSTTLAVELDDQRHLFAPTVRVQGHPGFTRGTLRVELVDWRGVVRRVARRELRAESLGAELRMPSFTVPHGADPDQVLSWRWDVVVEANGVDLVRWGRYLEVSTRINAEGEIALAGSREAMRSKQEEEGRGPEAAWDQRDSERLLTTLVSDGLIGPMERDEVLAAREPTCRTAERILIERGRVGERDLLSRYAELTGSEFVDLVRYPIDPRAAAMVPEELARRFGLMAIGFRGEMTTVAMSDPQNRDGLRTAEELVAGQVYVVVATRDDVIAALERSGSLELAGEPG